MKHKLKIMPSHFEAIRLGYKQFEIRNNSDRGFQKGDNVDLEEYDVGIALSKYTGNIAHVKILYVSDYNQPQNQVVFGFKLHKITTA